MGILPRGFLWKTSCSFFGKHLPHVSKEQQQNRLGKRKQISRSDIHYESSFIYMSHTDLFFFKEANLCHRGRKLHPSSYTADHLYLHITIISWYMFRRMWTSEISKTRGQIWTLGKWRGVCVFVCVGWGYSWCNLLTTSISAHYNRL